MALPCISPTQSRRQFSCFHSTAWRFRRTWRSGAAPMSAPTREPACNHSWPTCRSTTAGASRTPECSGAHISAIGFVVLIVSFYISIRPLLLCPERSLASYLGCSIYPRVLPRRHFVRRSRRCIALHLHPLPLLALIARSLHCPMPIASFSLRVPHTYRLFLIQSARYGRGRGDAGAGWAGGRRGPDGWHRRYQAAGSQQPVSRKVRSISYTP